jgi:ligand-binding sensor domain-containing protein
VRDSQGRIWIANERGPWESHAIGKDGQRAVTRPGMLIMEDSKRHLWFAEYSNGSTVLVRVAPDLQETRLPASKILPSLSEAPDGTFWALTDEGLIRIGTKTDQGKPSQISVIEKHPMRLEGHAEIWCDADGCVWLFENGGTRKSFLVRYATSSKR